MLLEHAHMEGDFDPGHCRICAHQAGLFDHYKRVQREENALSQAQEWARRAHRHAVRALWLSGGGILLAAIAMLAK